MMMKYGLLCVAVSMLGAASVHAENVLSQPQPTHFNYNYLEVSYIDLDEPSADGFRFKGSFDVNQNISVIGSYSIAEDGDLDVSFLTAGAAYHMALESPEIDKLDLVFHAEFERAKAEVKNHSKTDSGLLLGTEARVGLSEAFEVYGDASLRTTGDNDFLVTIGARFEFAPRFQGLMSYEFSDQDILSLGVRYAY